MKLVRRSFIISMFASLVILSSCASMGSKLGMSAGQSFIPVFPQDVIVVGTVREEVNAYSVLGLPPGLDKTYAVFSWGGNAYDRLLEKAYELGGHDVINMTVDYEDISLFFIFNRRKFIVNGLAVCYGSSEIVPIDETETEEASADDAETAAVSETDETADNPEPEADYAG